MPTISVIMGIYNCEKTLSDAIDSILNQTYTDWELIMCDDGSTDNTYEIATKYSEKDNRIKVLKNDKNSGLAFSLNHCLKYTTGEYVARMDADDISIPNRLELQKQFLDDNQGYAVVGSGAILFDGENVLGNRFPTEKPEKKDLIKGSPFMHPTIMMRKNIYEELNGYLVLPRTKKGQDLDLWYRLYSKGYKGYNLQQPLLKYREGLSDYNRRTIKSALLFMQTMFVGYRDLKISFIYYPFLLKPVISALIPKRVLFLYHKRAKIK